jgi:hypothetical protein
VAITVGGQRYQRKDKRVSSYKRISEKRGIRQTDLGRREGGGSAQEAATRTVQPPTSIQEANKIATSQPEPIASAVEGGVIFSDEFRGTPVATSAKGGVIYERNRMDVIDNRNYTPVNRFGNSNKVGVQETFTGTVKPAEKQSFFKAPVSYLERKGSQYEQKSSEYAGVSPGKSVRYGAGAFGLGLVTKGARFVEGVARIADPSEGGTIRQTGRLVTVGFSEVRSTGGLPSIGSYIRETPISAAADVSLGAATARISLPKRFPYPKAGVIGDVIEDAPKTILRGTTRTGVPPSVESSAGRALRTNKPGDIETAIGRINRDVYRRVDVTDISRLDNMAPSPPKETFSFKTTRSVRGEIDKITRRKKRGLYVEATQKVPIDNPRVINLGPKVPASKVIELGRKRLSKLEPRFDFVEAAQDTRKINFNKILDLERSPEARIASLTSPEYVNVYKRFPTESRKRFVDMSGEKIVYDDKRTTGYVLGIDRIRTGNRANPLTGVVLSEKNIAEITGGAYKTELRAARRTTAPSDTAAKFFEMDRKVNLKGKKPELKRRFELIRGKKGQAQLFRQETVVIEDSSKALRKRYGGINRRSRTRASSDLEPPSRSRQRFSSDFPEPSSRPILAETESSSVAKLVGKERFRLPPYVGLGSDSKYDVGSLTRTPQRADFRTYQSTSPAIAQDTAPAQGQFSFRSLTSSAQKGSQLLTAAAVVGGATTLSRFVKPGKNSINRYYRGGESGGGGGGSSEYNIKYGSKKKYIPSYLGIETGTKATRKQRRAAGTRGTGLSGLEVRGI